MELPFDILIDTLTDDEIAALVAERIQLEREDRFLAGVEELRQKERSGITEFVI